MRMQEDEVIALDRDAKAISKDRAALRSLPGRRLPAVTDSDRSTRTLASASVWLVGAMMVFTDLAFLAIHAAAVGSGSGDVSLFVDADHSHAEFFQYFKYGWAAMLLLVAIFKGGYQAYWVWVAIFVALALDDGLMLHERAGRIVTDVGILPNSTIAELVVTTTAALIVGILVLIVVRRTTGLVRRSFMQLIWLMVALAFFGIIMDGIHGSLGPANPEPGDWLALVEDGGEMLVISLAVVVCFRVARAALIGVPARPYVEATLSTRER